ncbi:MAG: 16S rRNA (uracil(1498)-N(3))-methyltransferase [Myxococcales bacterium]|nr:16S rRNA (uracil(1498)-N(3))-methyltransferase [Myxococcales bacterium]
MRQLFIDITDPAASVPLGAEVHHRLQRVLRLPIGAPLCVGNGRGQRWQVRFAGHHLTDWVALPVQLPPATELTLACAVLKGERFEWLIEKAAELGAFAIQPLQTEHCVAKVLGPAAAGKQARWQAVATEAFEQCGRPWLTRVLPPLALTQWLAQRHTQPALLVADERLPPVFLADAVVAHPPCQGRRQLDVVIGPEGGLGDGERLALKTAGGIDVWLSRAVLRAETAALAAAVIVQGRAEAENG